MHLTSPDGVHFCLLGERSIFLDLDRDRYFAASPEATQALLRAMNGTSILGVDEARLEPLLNEGLLCVRQDPSRSLSATTVPPVACHFNSRAKPALGLVGLAIRLQICAQRELRRRGLAAVLARRSRPTQASCHRSLEDIAAAVRASDLIISAHERCLMKSIALFDLLHRSGHQPTLVLGVRDCPFTAHAWVQLGDMVVGDTQERVARYQAILAM